MRPRYAPTDLPKLYICGYLNWVRASRRSEAETHRSIEVIWLLRYASLTGSACGRLGSIADGAKFLQNRGRDTHYCVPPAQIPAGGIPAPGSHLGCLTAQRLSGQGWVICGLGSHRFVSTVIRSHVTAPFWPRQRSVRRHRAATLWRKSESVAALVGTAHRNIEVIWLLRHLRPDFETIADFRRDNSKAFRPIFRQFVLLCRQLDLFGRELLAVDGTRIKAVNNKDRNFTRASLSEFIRLADAKLEDYLRRLDHSDVAETPAGGARVKNLAEKIAAIGARRTRCTEMLAELDKTGESQISLTDPDSRAMAAHTHVAVGYNIQVAVDTKHKLIVEQQVTNQVVDMGLLTQTAAPAKEVLGVEKIAVVADRGYFKIEDIEACEKAGIEPYVPRPQRGPRSRRAYFAKMSFDMIQPATVSFVRQASVYIPIRHRFCVD